MATGNLAALALRNEAGTFSKLFAFIFKNESRRGANFRHLCSAGSNCANRCGAALLGSVTRLYKPKYIVHTTTLQQYSSKCGKGSNDKDKDKDKSSKCGKSAKETKTEASNCNKPKKSKCSKPKKEEKGPKCGKTKKEKGPKCDKTKKEEKGSKCGKTKKEEKSSKCGKTKKKEKSNKCGESKKEKDSKCPKLTKNKGEECDQKESKKTKCCPYVEEECTESRKRRVSTCPKPKKKNPYEMISFGNVLLDSTARLNAEEFEMLNKFHIKPNSKGELEQELLIKLKDEVCKITKCIENPGGSVLNTNRIMQQLGVKTLFVGSVGKDRAAEVLRKLLKKVKVDARLKETEAHTGKCIAVINTSTGAEALYANEGASAKLQVKHLKKLEENKDLPFLRSPKKQQVLYFAGFFVPHHKEVCDYIAQNYIVGERRLAFNLSAEYLIKTECEKMLQFAEKSFLLFGNFIEFTALSKVVGIPCVGEMVRALIAANPKAPKIVAITHDKDKVQLITNYKDACSPPGKVQSMDFRVKKLSKVKDSTGAGDSFVAGFMYGFLKKHPLPVCVKYGNQVASEVIRKIGCNLPKGFKLKKV